MKFGIIKDNEFIEAPKVLCINGRIYLSPGDEMYRSYRGEEAPDGFLERYAVPEKREGYVATKIVGWEERDGKAVAQYKYVKIEDEEHEFSYSKYFLGRAIDAVGYFDILQQFFSDNPKAAFHWNNATDFVRGDVMFDSIEQALKGVVGEDGLKAVYDKYDELIKKERV